MLPDKRIFSEPQPGVLRTPSGCYLTVWVKEYSITKHTYSGVYNLDGQNLTSYVGNTISGSLFIREVDLQVVDTLFSLTLRVEKSYTIQFNHCYIGRVETSYWNHTDTKKINFCAANITVVRDEDPLLLDLEVPEEIQFIEKPIPLLKKIKPRRLKGRTAKVLAVAKRKLNK